MAPADTETTTDELDESEVLTTTAAPYVENPDFVPNPTDQYGTYDTSGTAGTAHSKLENVTPIFDVARQQDLVTAARALDPNDPEVPEHIVVLPHGQRLEPVDPDAARERIATKAQDAMENPVVVGGPNASQREAAQGTDYDDEGNENEHRAAGRAKAAAKKQTAAQSRAEAEKKVEEGRQANSPAGGGNQP